MRPKGCECGCPLGGMNSKQFVRSHMATMCVADFLTTEVWTMRGLVRYHTLFVMNLAKRQVEIAQISCQMNGQVMAQVGRNLTDSEDGFLDGMEYFVCDRDTLFTNEFCRTLETSGVKRRNDWPDSKTTRDRDRPRSATAGDHDRSAQSRRRRPIMQGNRPELEKCNHPGQP